MATARAILARRPIPPCSPLTDLARRTRTEPVLKPLPTLFIVCVIDVLGFGILIPLIPYMADRYGADPQIITPILGAYALCQLIAAPFWGRLSDRFGRRPILMWSLAGACVSYLMLGIASNVEWLLASRILGGFMAGNISAAMAYASDVSAPSDRAKSLGMIGAAIGIGFMLGPAIGGLLAGEDELTANFMRPAIASMGLSIVAILLVAFLLPESHTREHREAMAREAGPRPSPFALLARKPALRFIALAALLLMFSQAILESIFAIWALDRFGFGPRTVGILMFGLALVPVTMQGGLVRILVPRFGEYRLAQMAVVGYVAGLLIVAFASTLTITILGLALCGAGAGAFIPCGSALASKEADAGNRGVVMGTYQASSSLARVLGPFVSGPIYAALGPAAPFVLGACVTWPAALLIARSRQAHALAGTQPQADRSVVAGSEPSS